LKQLKNRVETYKKQTGRTSFSVDDKKQILDAMIDEKLVVQAAKRDGVSVSAGQAEQMFIQSISQQVGQTVSEQQFAQIVKEQTGNSLDTFFIEQVGMNVAEYKVYLQNQLTAQQYVLSLKEKEIQSVVSPTDADIRSYYEMNKTSFSQNDILKLFLVVVPKENNVNAAQNTAKKIYSQLENKEITVDEIKIKSQANDAVYQAGDMYVSKGTLAAQQLGIDYNALLSLFKNDTGFISDMTETATDFQFYIIREKYEAKMLALSDVVQPDKTVTVYEYIREVLAQQKQQIAFQSAVEDVTQSLRTPSNFRMLKSGSELNALLEW
ncbi:MAG TPA: peptidyl-prolyl cis-trans isomerase, partial [Treponemataceae bacterium]|nr:peptidyl-prolyl cis-trans isomerase [Treponemataceae bacterium]